MLAYGRRLGLGLGRHRVDVMRWLWAWGPRWGLLWLHGAFGVSRSFGGLWRTALDIIAQRA
jgi:hypothetical protein